MTIVEKILAAHSDKERVAPGDIIDVKIDARAARDFGGANVVQHMERYHLSIDDPSKTFFTFDCNPTGSDQKYAANQHRCRTYARSHGIRVYDINRGIGTHLMIEEGLAYPGSTAISTDSHANILGAVGAFGQGMGDKDIAAAWHRGSIWFKVPPSVKIRLKGMADPALTAKDLTLNLLKKFGSSTLLGTAIELDGEYVEKLSLDQRITIASMATEMGAIILFLTPNSEVIRYCESRSRKKMDPVVADPDALYLREYDLDLSAFSVRLSMPGKPHDTSPVPDRKIWIDSAFIGSCTNGRMEDLREAAQVLKGRKVADGVVLKIVPATDHIWQHCLDEGLLDIFKDAGALVSNAGCAGCAAGQVGQNGPGEVTISTGNRNFPGKQGQGQVYLASPPVAAASAVAGFITTPERIPEKPESRPVQKSMEQAPLSPDRKNVNERPVEIRAKAWVIPRDDIDTDMIFHNRHLSITERSEMGKYAFGNLQGYEDFSQKVKPGDIIVAGKNFGSGSSRQQAVDCFLALELGCIVAESFGAIYERNAINAAFPILTCPGLGDIPMEDGDELSVNLATGKLRNLTRGSRAEAIPFSEVQMEIYQNNGLF